MKKDMMNDTRTIESLTPDQMKHRINFSHNNDRVCSENSIAELQLMISEISYLVDSHDMFNPRLLHAVRLYQCLAIESYRSDIFVNTIDGITFKIYATDTTEYHDIGQMICKFSIAEHVTFDCLQAEHVSIFEIIGYDICSMFPAVKRFSCSLFVTDM